MYRIEQSQYNQMIDHLSNDTISYLIDINTHSKIVFKNKIYELKL